MNERGFSLMEAMMGAVISVIAVLGLAYTFGVGRALVDHYSVSRAALAKAEGRVELLTLEDAAISPLLAVGYVSATTPFVFEAATIGSESWRVTGYDVPTLPGALNLRLATVTVRWQQGGRADSVSLARLFPL